ncbi:hypothetical protein EJ08DRAFT_110275 [Tothia fuscella]|uniref:C2H2-type domain-containing protein n=1 Tax=Tothia fuscella TaxID=1048955 RepID=A0A9P4NUW2_9PEZI|nr:hypothetical protein EJ08DRAFT_110275 [Tothia fuscella]
MSDQNAYDPVSTYLDQSMEPNLEGVGALFDSREFSSRFSPYGRSSSRADSDTSGRTYGSSTNHSSVGSVISTNSRLSRRGRRRYLSHQTTSHISQNKKGVTIWKDSNSKKYRYFCTFCSDPFPDRYSWNRHEESIHMPRTLWVCSFDTQIPTEKGPCDYCLEIIEHNDWTRHLSSHRYAECALRREIDRTFYRKDHFKQHLVGFHRMSHCVVQSWPDGSRQDAPPLLPGCLELRCGLCGQHCKDWKMRVDHVADHFEKGAIEAQWHFRRAYDAHLSGLKQAE